MPLLDLMQMQKDLMKLKKAQKTSRDDFETMSETVNKLSFVKSDMFITPEMLENKLDELKMGYHAKIDMRMNKIASNFADTIKEVETKCN